jgi:hypothetical protein
MDQSPWESNIRLAGQEIPRLFIDPKVHYRIHNSPQLNPAPSHMDTVLHISYVFKIHINVILHFTPRTHKWSHTSLQVFRPKFCMNLSYLWLVWNIFTC